MVQFTQKDESGCLYGSYSVNGSHKVIEVYSEEEKKTLIKKGMLFSKSALIKNGLDVLFIGKYPDNSAIYSISSLFFVHVNSDKIVVLID